MDEANQVGEKEHDDEGEQAAPDGDLHFFVSAGILVSLLRFDALVLEVFIRRIECKTLVVSHERIRVLHWAVVVFRGGGR